MKRIGFLVNPEAGRGGRYALKGSDDPELLESIPNSERPAIVRARRFLERVRKWALNIEWVMAPGSMGEEVLEGPIIFTPTTAQDTRTFLKENMANLDACVVVGGDGTLRDVQAEIGTALPILAVPGGVKMTSPAFVHSTQEALETLHLFTGDFAQTSPQDVTDADEGALREGSYVLATFGEVMAIFPPGAQATGKSQIPAPELERDAVLAALDLETKDAPRIIVGPGSTLAAWKRVRWEGTLGTGFDVIEDNQVTVGDATASELVMAVQGSGRTILVISPIGRSGALLGRGNQQVDAAVLAALGFDAILVVATRSKLAVTPELFVDLDIGKGELPIPTHIRVLVGVDEWVLRPLTN